MGVCQSNENTGSGNTEINTDVKPQEFKPDDKPSSDPTGPVDKEMENAVLKIQGNLRVKQAKKQAEERKAELAQDKPQDWIPITETFEQPALPSQFKEKIIKQLTEDRVLPSLQYLDGTIYEGQWKNGQQNGYGRMKKPHGIYVEGYWKNGVFSKGGTLFPNGEYQIVDNGHGFHYFTDGSIYEGDINNEVRNGNGIIKYTDQSKYEGQFLNGKKNGKGTLITSEGKIIKCEYKDDKLISG